MKRLLSLLFILMLIVPVTQAQDATAASIELTGVVQLIDDTRITLEGLTVDVSQLDARLVAQVTVGSRIRVTGYLENGIIVATTLGIIDDDTTPDDLIDLEAYISIDDGATWQDADAAPGPQVETGAQVLFRLSVRNTSPTELQNIGLVNSAYDTSTCNMPMNLAADASFDCQLGPFTAEPGQQSNTTSVLAQSPFAQIGDTDAIFYFVGDRPSIDIETFVSVDSALWHDADSAPGLKVHIGEEVFFRIVITNNGNVELSDITLTGSIFGLNTCSVPPTLAVSESFECITGSTEATASWHNDSATVTAVHRTTSTTDTDSVIYYGSELEDDDPVIVVIEGPIQVINVNVITIFDIDIVIDPDDPILLDLKVGDIIHIEGEMDNDANGNIIIIVVNITIVNVVIIDAPPGIPGNCKVSKDGRIKCSGRGSKGSGRGSKKSS